jgi:hypothetical protein
MDALTIRFDEVWLVRQDGGWGYRSYWPRQTVFSFMSAGKYVPYVTTPGWPGIHNGLTVTALLEVTDDWKSLLGWINRETGEIAGPSPAELLKQAGVESVWLSVGVFMLILGIPNASIMAIVGVLFSGFFAYTLFVAFRDWGKANATLEALKRLAEDVRYNKSLETETHLQAAASAHELRSSQVRRHHAAGRRQR